MSAPVPSRRQRVPAGTILNGLYEVERLIGTGGMGEIYRGRAFETGEAVAIKMLREEHAASALSMDLFRREAQALRRLQHEAIVRYYVFTVDPDLQVPYLVMDLVEGVHLSEVLRERALGADEVMRLARRLASGLGAAHALGIVHRDISPDNVMIPAEGVSAAKILDFGIARASGPGAQTTIIGAGFAGKLNYVSPEQIGMFDGVGPRSDIYSLGLVLAAASRGRPLDMGASHAEVVERRQAVPDLAEVDARLRPLLTRMLQPDPVKRPATMAEVAAWRLPAAAPDQAGWRRPALVAALGATTLAVLAVVATPPLTRWLGREPARQVEPQPGRVPAEPAPTVPLPAPPSGPVAQPPGPAGPQPTAPIATEPPAGPAPPPVASPQPAQTSPETGRPLEEPERVVGQPTPGEPRERSLIRLAQIELRRLECYAGPIDGTLNEATRAALTLFAERQNLVWSGTVEDGAVEWLQRSETGACRGVSNVQPGPPPEQPRQASAAASCRALTEQVQLGTLPPAEYERLRAACR